LLVDALAFHRNKSIRSPDSGTFDIADLPEAAQHVGSDTHTGTFVLKCSSESIVPVCVTAQHCMILLADTFHRFMFPTSP
jgi:hypothetical protein